MCILVVYVCDGTANTKIALYALPTYIRGKRRRRGGIEYLRENRLKFFTEYVSSAVTRSVVTLQLCENFKEMEEGFARVEVN